MRRFSYSLLTIDNSQITQKEMETFMRWLLFLEVGT